MRSQLVQRSFVLFFLIALIPLSSFGQKPGRDPILFSKLMSGKSAFQFYPIALADGNGGE